jgi:hypothetical protein
MGDLLSLLYLIIIIFNYWISFEEFLQHRMIWIKLNLKNDIAVLTSYLLIHV